MGKMQETTTGDTTKASIFPKLLKEVIDYRIVNDSKHPGAAVRIGLVQILLHTVCGRSLILPYINFSPKIL